MKQRLSGPLEGRTPRRFSFALPPRSSYRVSCCRGRRRALRFPGANGGRNSVERFSATYRVETPLPVAQAAAVLAGEQSSGTFVAVPGETAELKQRFAARVEKIT